MWLIELLLYWGRLACGDELVNDLVFTLVFLRVDDYNFRGKPQMDSRMKNEAGRAGRKKERSVAKSVESSGGHGLQC